MKAVIVGLGSIGRRHLANLRALDPTARIMVCRHAEPPKGRGGEPQADATVFRLEEAVDFGPDVAFLTGPASLHVEMGLALARHGIHLFIEKPLSHTLDRVDELLRVCREQSLVLMVGYNLRFYRPLQVLREALHDGRIGRPLALRAEVGQYLPDWRPGTDYRRSVSARQALGGGAALELSHELDSARWLMGEVRSVVAQLGRVSDLEIDVEDTAEILLEFESGAVGSVHLDMVQRPARRAYRVTGTLGTLAWDWDDHRVRWYSAEAAEWRDLCDETGYDRNAMYVEELRHFLACVSDSRAPAVTGEDGCRAVEIVAAAKESARTGRRVTL